MYNIITPRGKKSQHVSMCACPCVSDYVPYCCCLVVVSSSFCDPMNCSPPISSVHGISQARILEWVTISSSRRSSWPRDGTHIWISGRFFIAEPLGKLTCLLYTYKISGRIDKKIISNDCLWEIGMDTVGKRTFFLFY